VQLVVDRNKAKAAAKGITLETHVAPDLPPVRLCEPFLVDALGRLVSNGIKFSREVGQRVLITALASGEWIEISVIDQGVGVPPDKTGSLFKRFQQINREKTEQQGTGVGLAIARDLIRLHKGDISVVSEPGQGSAFTVRLPVA
jgi:signal transduction histidine kinase